MRIGPLLITVTLVVGIISDGSKRYNSGDQGNTVIQFGADTDRALLKDAFRFAQHQVRELIVRDPDLYPMYTTNGRWKHEGAAWTKWCDGFLPGMMWIFLKRPRDNGTDERFWLEQAIR